MTDGPGRGIGTPPVYCEAQLSQPASRATFNTVNCVAAAGDAGSGPRWSSRPPSGNFCSYAACAAAVVDAVCVTLTDRALTVSLTESTGRTCVCGRCQVTLYA